MKIGIDASRAFIKNRTGIEEYSYQIIKHLVDKLDKHEVILYIKKNQKSKIKNQNGNVKLRGNHVALRNSKLKIDDLELPNNWSIKVINFPRLWTQIGLSLEMLFHPVDVLFIPAHTVPIIHPKNTIVTIHGLEYEFCPQAYSWWEKLYMRWSIKNSCRWAKTIIAVSENTKKDLVKLYKVPEDKIEVIYEGYNPNSEFRISNFESNSNEQISKPYLLFIGRLEKRKNILGIIEAYKILKEKYNLPHSLVLAGSPGYGYEKIKFKIQNSKFKILELGYVSEAQKFDLLSKAEVFLFPSFYEGFGLPILEAQSQGVPVVAGDNSSMPEIVKLPLRPMGEGGRRPDEGNLENPHPNPLPRGEGDSFSAILVNPKNPSEIAEAAYKLISDKNLREEIIKRGFANVKKISWDKCAEEICKLITN